MTRLLAHRAWGLVLLAFTLALSGCQGTGAEAGVGLEPQCVADRDCPPNEGCRFGLCASTDAAQYAVALRIDPPEFRPDLVRQQVLDVPVQLGTPIQDYGLTRPVRLEGFLVWDDRDAGPVVATVAIRATSGIPGLQYSTSVRTSDATGRFTAELPPGRYNLTVLPERENVPKTLLADLIVRGGGSNCTGNGPCQTEIFVLPAPGRYFRVQGELVQRTTQLVPVAGARVYATSPTQNLESTSAITDESGRFTLFVSPSVNELQFHVRGTDAQPWPSATFATTSLPNPLPELFEVSLWNADWTPQVTVPLAIDPGNAEVSTLVVTVRAALAPVETGTDALGVLRGDAVRTWQLDETTDLSNFPISLAAGNWEVTVASRAPGHLAAAARIEVPAGLRGGAAAPILQAPVPLRIESSPPVRMTVRDATGAPVAGAIVDARPLRVEDVPFESLGIDTEAWRMSGSTDDAGTLVLPVVPGTWLFRLTPPEGRALPVWEVVAPVVANAPLALAFVAGGIVQGRVRDDSGLPLPGAAVEAWWVDEGRAWPVAEGLADGDGVYRLVLPAEIPAGRTAASASP